MLTGGINEKNLLDYLSFNKIICCGGSWMVPGDAVKAGDWDRIRALTSSGRQLMLGPEDRARASTAPTRPRPWIPRPSCASQVAGR